MIITPVDNRKDLFLVEQIFPQDLLDRINQLNFTDLNTEFMEMQEDWPCRRRVLYDEDSLFAIIHRQVKKQVVTISQIIEQPISDCDTGFWLDTEGFTTNLHLDNEQVYIAMQVYLTEAESALGTEFYHQDDSVRFSTPYRQNFGYLMVNNNDQMHGMLNPVPVGHNRLSSYTWFYR